MKEADVILAGGRVLLLDDQDTILERGAVAVVGDSIAAVGTPEEIDRDFTARKRIDCSNGLLLPGLVNAHTHAAMTCFRGIADDLDLMDWLSNYIFPAEARNVDPELAYWGSMLACAEMILSGTTTFCDMYIFEDETARAAHEAGMRCLLGEVLFDFPSPNVKTPGEGLRYTEMLIQKWADDPLVNIVVEPHALYTCSPTLLKDAKALADAYGVPVATHYLENTTEPGLIQEKLGMRASDFLKKIGYLDEHFFVFHGVYMDDEDIRLFADHGCKVVHNPESNMKLASGVAPVSRMIDAGIAVGLGTDGCASNNNLDLFQEMDTAAKLEKSVRLDPTVMSARTVLRMATCNGAKVLGLDHLVGSIRPGMKADLVLVKLDKPHLTPMYSEYSHLVYAVNGSDADTVLINGKVVMEARKLLTIDVNEAMERVLKIAERVRRSMET
ncbi:MAG TPA: amidohydrolase [Syntrophales bacterium]|nr:amidohydrolase [Syntrophales bacterium]